MTFTCSSTSELKNIAAQILQNFAQHRIFLLEGEMGAGKTTLTKAFCEILHCENAASSPTFSIVNEYFSPQHRTVYHFDCYRLKSENEALDIGIEDYLDSNFYCFIEWPEKIFNLIPANHIVIQIEEANLIRKITVEER
ncbi:MAG: tRNA (adenosine(37)-N6)-threonylcarbamoyltransferase complex ATPase subunit type 1 TsaE [Flavobacteriales bacterium]